MKALAYRFTVRLLALPFCILLALRGLRDRGYWRGFSQRFGLGVAQPAGSIWLHAVSVGEVQAAAALVRALRETYPERALTLTTTTPTGAARARALFGEAIDVRFLPLDTPGCVRRFLDRVQPAIGIIIEKEIWPQLYHECTVRGVPIVLASAAVAPRAVSRYRRLLGIHPGTLARGLTVAAQSEADATRFASVGVPSTRVQVIGNLKFDLALPPGLAAAGSAMRERCGWRDRFVLVGGSTYEAEEDALLQVQQRLRHEGLDVALVLAPRHPPRFAEVAARLQKSGVFYRRYSASDRSTNSLSADTAPVERIDVLLLDTLGDLLPCYAAADVAFVGGSLIEGIGGHNLIEPAALAIPTITGPHGKNSADVAAALVAHRALEIVTDVDSMITTLRRWAADAAARRDYGERAKEFVAGNRGTLQRLLAVIAPLIAGAKSP